MNKKLIAACALSMTLTAGPVQAGFLGDVWSAVKDAVSEAIDYIVIGAQYTAGGANLAGHYLEGFFTRNFADGQSGLPDLKAWEFKAMAIQREVDKDVPLAEATFLMTHNSYNAKDYQTAIRYLDPNQHYNIVKQLMVGVRALELDIWDTGGRLRLCHGGVCSATDRYFTQGLEEVADWFTLPSSRDEVIIIYLEDHMDSTDDYAQAISEINSRIGSLVYRPANGGNSCEGIPMNISKQDVLNAGKNIILMSDDEACSATQDWKSWVYGGVGDSLNGFVTGSQGSKLNQGTACSGGKGFTRNTYNTYLVRYFEDRTILGAAHANATGNPQEHLNAADVEAVLKCGANLPGLDHLGYEGGNRFTATVWSWDVNEPNNHAGNQDCAVSWANGRWDDAFCTDVHRFACHNPATRQWAVSASSGAWNRDTADAACASLGAGYQFSVPYNSYENEQLKAAKSAAGVTHVWLNFNDIKMEGLWKKTEGSQLIYGTWVSSQGTTVDSLSNPMASLTLKQAETVELNLKSTNANAYLHLLDANKSVMTSDDNGGEGNNARITYTLNAGTYYVTAATAGSNEAGNFELTTNKGELRFVNGLTVKAVNSYYWVYDDHDTGSNQDIAMWRPHLPLGYAMLGDVAMNRHGQAPTYKTLIVQDAPGATVRPTDYLMKWHDGGSGGTHDVAFWRPVAPAGYTCVGSVITIGYNKPSTDLVRCVRSEYVLPAGNTRVWSDAGSGANWDGSAWVALTKTSHGMNTGAFVAGDGHGNGGDGIYFGLNRHHFIDEQQVNYHLIESNYDKCLVVESNNNINGTACDLASDSQLFHFDQDTGIIRPKSATNMCLDVEGTNAGSNISVKECNGTAHQRWTRDGEFLRSQLNTGMVLDFNNSNAHLWGHDGGNNNQKFTWTHVPGEFFQLEVQGKCVAVENGSANDGANITATTCNSSDSAQLFKYDAGMLRSKLNTNKCIDVWQGGTHNGANIILWGCHGGNNQRWDYSKGIMTSRMNSHMKMDYNGSNTVHLWGYHGGSNQKFKPTLR